MLLQEEKEKISSQAEIMFAKFPPRELFQYRILCYQNNGFIQQALCQLFGYNYSVFLSQVLYWYLGFFFFKGGGGEVILYVQQTTATLDAVKKKKGKF